jgi:serine/threonine protein kinase
MFFEGIYTKVEKSKSKVEFVQSLNHSTSENPIHCNFFEIGAKVLQSIKSPVVMGFSRVERNSKNVEVYASMSPGRSFPEYLSSLSSISDERFTELVTQLAVCIEAVHSEGFYHQALNPNSFWVTEDGEIQLTLFETLEMRFCQQQAEEIQSIPSIQAIQQYLSPERRNDLKTLSFSDEYYSFGLIAWYIWCWKIGRISKQTTQNTLPPFEATGTPWDRLWDSCLHKNRAIRPNLIDSIKSIIEEITLKLGVKKEDPEIEKEVKTEPTYSEKAFVFSNYSADHYQIFCNKRPITNLFQKIQGTTLTVHIPAGSIIEIYNNFDDTLLDSFNSNDKQEYSLPIVPKKPISKPMEKKSSLSAAQVGLILGALIIIIGVVIYLKISPPPPDPKPTDVDGPTFAMVPPDGYTIIDTINNNILRKGGFDVDGTKWRFKEENWEKFVPGEKGDSDGKWVKDNSQKVKLLDTYFEKIEVIESEGELPPNYELIKGNDSILYHYGKKALDDNFYRYVNKRWYRKEGQRWIKLVSFEDYRDVLESYFVELRLLQIQPMDYGYVQGDGVRYRSEPSDRNVKTILGYFKSYKTYADGSPLTKYENITPDYVYVLFEKNDWYLVQISQNSKLAWMYKKQFVSEPVCYVPTPEEDENP